MFGGVETHIGVALCLELVGKVILRAFFVGCIGCSA